MSPTMDEMTVALPENVHKLTQPGYGFLFAFHSNYGRVLSRFDTIHERDRHPTTAQQRRPRLCKTWLAVWLSGNALASINVVALRQTRLVPGWVTVCGRVNHFGI